MTELLLPTGRRLRYDTHGAADGSLVFCLHGTPGSRIGLHPTAEAIAANGALVVTYDRPGYGGSDRHPGRTVGDAAADVAAIATALGREKFAVYGYSGGGPHALACAARLGNRVTRAASVVGIAPFLAEGLNWFAGMTASNIAEFGTALVGEKALTESLGPVVDVMRDNPAALIDELATELPEPDRAVMTDPAIRERLAGNFGESARFGPYGWVDDDLAFAQPWGFEVADIKVPTLLWHGAEDVLAPAAHSQWLATQIGGAVLYIAPGAGHMASIAALDSLLPWLLGATDTVG